MGNRPGVMLYFEIREPLSGLSMEQKGRLFEAIMEYGASGILPGFSDDPVLGIVWSFVKPRIDADGERYSDICEKRRSAANARWKKEPEATLSDANANASMCMQVDANDTNINTTSTQHQLNLNLNCRREAIASPFGEGEEEREADFETRRQRAIERLLKEGGL